MSIGAASNARSHVSRTGVGHLIRREERQPRLIPPAIRTPVPGHASSRAIVDALVRLIVRVEEMLGELRVRVEVF